MEEKILLHYIEKDEYKLFYPLENIKILNTFAFSVILHYIWFCYKNKIISELFILIFYYILFFLISIFMNLKTTNFLKNAIFLFITILLKESNEKINIHNICYYFIVITISYFLNAFYLCLLNNPRTIKDIFCNKENSCVDKILYISFYFIIDFLNGLLHYYFPKVIREIKEKYISSDDIICVLFVILFYLGGYYFSQIFKAKKPQFATIFKKFIMLFILNLTMGWYSFQLFLYLGKKQFIDKIYLFAFFLFSIFLLGFSVEFLFNSFIFKYIRNHFNICLYSIIYFCYILPYFIEIYSYHFIYFIMILFRFISFFLFKYKKIHFIQYISDYTILALLVTLFFQKWGYVGIIITVYCIKSIVECLVMRNNLSMYCKNMILNLISMLILFTFLKKIEIIKERKIIEKSKKNNDINSKYSSFSNYNPSSDISDIIFIENQKKEPIKFDELDCLLRLKENLFDYKNKEKESEYYSKLPKNNSLENTFEYYQIFQCLEKIKEDDIKKKLKENYEESLIDDEKYILEWNDKICQKYLNKFVLFKLNKITYNNNLVTIFISGFLTEDKNSFAECYEKYFFKDNFKSNYYCFLWPSCGGIDSDTSIFSLIAQSINLLDGIGCKFEEAYKNAEIAGEILSNIIGCKKFFGNAQINLVGHSLGCRVIHKCLEHFSQNFSDMDTTIKDVILLAGATSINDFRFNIIVNEFVNGRFIHCFNKKDNALFISQPFSDCPIGLRKIDGDNKIENYETDLEHTNYCDNLGFILTNVNKMRKKSISFI